MHIARSRSGPRNGQVGPREEYLFLVANRMSHTRSYCGVLAGSRVYNLSEIFVVWKGISQFS